jgi:SulP family sulfate permease
MPALAAILAVVAYIMSEWRTFRAPLRSPRSDVAVLLVTFGLTVAVDLAVAIEAGMLLSLLLFMRSMSDSVRIHPLGEAIRGEDGEEPAWRRGPLPEGIEVFDVQGPLSRCPLGLSRMRGSHARSSGRRSVSRKASR